MDLLGLFTAAGLAVGVLGTVVLLGSVVLLPLADRLPPRAPAPARVPARVPARALPSITPN